MDHFDDHRFETFKMGNATHSRSHSRNSSISLSVSTSIKSTNSLEIVPSKRNSHHRRRSSVSTRHESAELMGVPVPELTPSPSRDSFNIGEKDSIRQRALWALEGKPDASYVKVEIPELSTSEIDTQLMFDFPTRPSFPPGIGAGFGPGVSTKRDSFKLLGGGIGSKDQLGTLLEEEEEDLDAENQPITPAPTPLEPMTPVSPESPPPVPVAVPQRPRPAGLKLRPLSLASEVSATNLITAASAPATNSRPGLKSLSLLSNTLDDSTKHATTNNEAMPNPSPNLRRPALNLQISSESLASSATCVSSASEDGSMGKALRRSSISYKFSPANNVAGLPTPEMTPTFSERRYSGHSVSSLSSRSSSLSSNADFSALNGEDESIQSAPAFSRNGAQPRHRALSASEQHFLFKSHNALLARITDLERALSLRRRESYGFTGQDGGDSRPISTTSDVSSSNSTPSEPMDEMLSLVADLKAERDELKRDVDGWRTRVGDLEKQIGVFVKRVDNERRDAWVARSRVGLLEVEKSGLLKDADTKESVIAELNKLVEELEEQKRVMIEEIALLKAQNEHLALEKSDVEAEVERWRKECDRLRSYEDESALATPTPGLIHSFEPTAPSSLPHHFGFALKSRKQTSADGDMSDEDGLAGYEDEEEGDLSCHSSSSSFDSQVDYPRSVTQMDIPVSPITPVSPHKLSDESNPMQRAFQFPVRSHQSNSSLSKTWTFPQGGQINNGDMSTSESVDRFFGCLDTSKSESANTFTASEDYTFERSKDLFSQALKEVSDDDTPFFVPRGAGTLVSSDSASSLDAVAEESEPEEEDSDRLSVQDDDDMFGDVGGIKITFTPPQDHDEDILRTEFPSFSPTPVAEPSQSSDGDRMRTFTFGRPLQGTSAIITPPKSVPRASAASAIPRATAKYSSSPEPTVTPPKLHNPRFGSPSSNPSPSTTVFVTPPSKRGGVMPSFIPQPITPPSPGRTADKQAPARATFIRQPQRRPLISTNGVAAQNTANAEQPMTSINTRRFLPGDTEFAEASGGAQDSSVDLKHSTIFPPTTPKYHIPPHSSSPANSSFTSFMTAPISSLQTFTNMIPLSWSPVGNDDAMNWSHPTRSATSVGRGSYKRGYVSKEAQLAKLKVRLSRERISSRSGGACGKCADEPVFL